MTKILLGAICILFSININAQQWKTASNPFTKSSFMDISFVSENQGWIVGTLGVILHTSDGGMTWEEQNSGTSKDITKIFFIDENYGWAGTGNNFLATTGGTILKTTDGGKNWNEIDYSNAVPNIAFTYCDGIYFVDSLSGSMIAGKSKSNFILKTTDGGLSWVKTDSLIATTFLRWYDIQFYNKNLGAVVGNNKGAQRFTTDGGETWTASTPISDPFFKDLRSVQWLSETELLALGEGQEFQGVPTPIYKSTDGGATWVKKTQSPVNSYDRIKDAYFKNATDGIAVGSNGFAFPFIYKTSDAGETWIPTNANYGFSFRALSGSGDVLFGIGTGSHIVKSKDFGVTWEVIPVKPPVSIYEIQFVGNKGYALTRSGDILKNEDGTGDEWNYISSTDLWETTSMHFIDENTGFVLKENRFIVKTTDGGDSWSSVLSSVPFGSRNKVGGITFGDNNNGYAWMSLNDYGDYYVYKSTDGGDNWGELIMIGGPGSISGNTGFFDANNGFLAGPDTWLKRTTDGGMNWNDAVINNLPAEFLKSDFEAISVINENEAMIVGNKIILKTTDKGASWEYVNHNVSDIDSAFYTVAFYDNNLGYIGCFNGVILETTDGGTSWTKDETFKDSVIFFSSGFNKNGEVFFGTSVGSIIKWDIPTDVKDKNVIVDHYFLSQNYPNPFNPSTIIKFGLETGGIVELTIYDMLGRKVRTLANKFYNEGIHSISFDAKELSSGIYYYRIKTGSYNKTNKMILMK